MEIFWFIAGVFVGVSFVASVTYKLNEDAKRAVAQARREVEDAQLQMYKTTAALIEFREMAGLDK